jgi:hypothetical protein
LNILVGLLPIVTLAAICLAVRQHTGDIRHALLRGAVLWGIFSALSLEILGRFRLINRTSLTVLWIAALFSLLVYLAMMAEQDRKLFLPRVVKPESGSEWVMTIGIAVIVILTGVIAWKAPPNTWDALNYHMPRVAHWAQQNSLDHFATGIEFQNYLPPGASYLVLQFYVLSSSDLLVNFVQWLAMVGSLIGGMWIVAELGVGRFGQYAAGVFAATLPMGILQATSSVNDYVLSFWLICVAAEFIKFYHEPSAQSLGFLSAAAGMALVTKYTSLPYLLPFALATAALMLQRRKEKSIYPGAVLGLLLVVILNWSYLQRNLQTYGNPAGPQDRIGDQTTQTLDPRALASNILRNLSLQAGTPSRYVNKGIAIAINWLHERGGIDPNDPRTTSEGVFRVKPPITHETVASNPLQAYFSVGFLAYMLLRRKDVPDDVQRYTWFNVAGFVLLSLIFKWKVTGARYQLPFFVLLAPSAGWFLEKTLSRRISLPVIGILLLGAIPALFLNPSRPLVNGVMDSSVGSVLAEARDKLYFANAGYEAAPYFEMTEIVRGSVCEDIGLMLPGGEIEYQIWSLLGAPREPLTIEWIVAGTPSARYANPSFQPCAVFCLDCPDGWGEAGGLKSVYRASPFELFMVVDETSE